MAQATNQITLRAESIEISNNGSTWTDISGFANSIGIGGGERNVGEFHTADGDTPVLGAGKRSSLELTVRILYTEGVSDPFATVLSAYENATPLYVRYSPLGGQATENMFTSSAGIVKTHPYPQGEVQAGDPTAIEFTVQVASITKSVVSS